MKLIFGIALVLSFLMLGDSVALIAPLFGFAIWLALPVLDQLSEMVEGETPAHY